MFTNRMQYNIDKVSPQKKKKKHLQGLNFKHQSKHTLRKQPSNVNKN